MLERWKNRRAAIRTFIEFLDVFESYDKEQNSRLMYIFIHEYRKAYERAKFDFNSLKNMKKFRLSMNIDVKHIKDVGKYPIVQEFFKRMGVVISYLNQVSNAQINLQAELLGKSLGEFLASIEYGLTAREFLNIDKKMENIIINYAERIKQKMEELGHSVKPKFIAKRVEKIAKEHAGELSEKQQFLIATIAEIFMY